MKNFAKIAAVMGFCLLGIAPAAANSPQPGSWDGYVFQDGSVSYTEVFRADELAMVTLYGDGRSDIDLWVYDEYGNLIAKSTGYGSFEEVTFVPAWTGMFSIVVENNYHPFSSTFELATN